MSLNRLTLYFSLAILAAIIGFDVWTLLARGYETTISWNLLGVSKQFPIIPFAIGVVCGHIWWSNKANEDGQKTQEKADKAPEQ